MGTAEGTRGVRLPPESPGCGTRSGLTWALSPMEGKLFLFLLLHRAKAFGACSAEKGFIPNLPMPD